MTEALDTGNAAIRHRLLNLAKARCLPYLLAEPGISLKADHIAFLVVGSVAAGLCHNDSDIDIALLCDPDVYCELSVGTPWPAGKPIEVTFDGVRLHYYGITLDMIAAKVKDLDDVYLYVYSQTLTLKESHSKHAERLVHLTQGNQDLRRLRAEGKLDMLLRRSRALRVAVEEGDPVVICKVFLECITLALKVIALLDNMPFDPRKRFFATALSGPLGRRLDAQVRAMLGRLDVLGIQGDLRGPASVLSRGVDEITGVLAETAKGQGLSVGLGKPDMRHAEN